MKLYIAKKIFIASLVMIITTGCVEVHNDGKVVVGDNRENNSNPKTGINIKSGNVDADVSVNDQLLKSNKEMAEQIEQLIDENDKLLEKISDLENQLSESQKNNSSGEHTNGENAYDWMNECKPFIYEFGQEYIANSNSTASFTMSGKKYYQGFTLGNLWTIPYNAYAVFNLDQKYSNVSFLVGHVDQKSGYGTQKNETLRIYVDDKLVDEYELKVSGVAFRVTIPLKNATQLKLAISGTRNLWGFADGTFN